MKCMPFTIWNKLSKVVGIKALQIYLICSQNLR